MQTLSIFEILTISKILLAVGCSMDLIHTLHNSYFIMLLTVPSIENIQTMANDWDQKKKKDMGGEKKFTSNL